MKVKYRFYAENDKVIWDGKNNKALCRFKDGELETTDERTADILKSMRFKFDELVLREPEKESKVEAASSKPVETKREEVEPKRDRRR